MARAPLYLLVGDDDLLLQRATERLLADLRSDDPDLDIEAFDASETAHLPELRTASLFGGTRVVVLRGAEALTDTLKQEVEGYVASPSDDATLVLVARGTGRIQTISRAVGGRKGVGERIEVSVPRDFDRAGWEKLVEAEFLTAGRTADRSAVAAILDHAGNAPAVIATKVLQVAASVDGGRRVTAADVEKVVEGHGNRGGFAIADAVAQRDPAEAIVLLRGALEAGEAPLAVLGAIVFRIRKLLQIRGGANAGEAGVSPGQYRFLKGMANSFGPGELAWVHDRLARCDLELKGSDLPAPLVLEVAVIEVATPGAYRPAAVSV